MKKNERNVETFKVRKTGGSYAITLSRDARKALDVLEGDSIRYIVTDDNEVIIQKSISSVDLDTAALSAINQYMSLINKMDKD